MSVADLLAAVPEGTEELDVALLERHQLYPMHRLVRDVEKAWECGIFSVNLVPEPVTAFELVEQCFPSLVNRLPSRRKRTRTEAQNIRLLHSVPRSGHRLYHGQAGCPGGAFPGQTVLAPGSKKLFPDPVCFLRSRGLYSPLQKSSTAGAVLSC